MDKFEILHKYNKLVRRELAHPIVCGKDGWEYVVRHNDGVTPLLRCYYCGGTLTPGDKMYAEWQRIVEERLK